MTSQTSFPGMRRKWGIALVLMLMPGLLAGCGDSAQTTAYRAYRKDPRAALKEIVRCESNYAAIGHTPECRAAMRVNAELFPVNR